jgi:hypothetical protein
VLCLYLFRACILRRLCALIVEADPPDLWLLGVQSGIFVEFDDDTVKIVVWLARLWLKAPGIGYLRTRVTHPKFLRFFMNRLSPLLT